MNRPPSGLVVEDMKAALTLLALWIGTVQTVTFTDCACGAVCENKGSCQACPTEEPAPAGCCHEEPAPAPADRACTHLDPSHDTTVESVPAASPLLVTIAALSPDDVVHPDLPVASAPADAVPRPAREGPLHLLNSVLII